MHPPVAPARRAFMVVGLTVALLPWGGAAQAAEAAASSGVLAELPAEVLADLSWSERSAVAKTMTKDPAAGTPVALVVDEGGRPTITSVRAASGAAADLAALLADQPSVDSAEVDGVARISATASNDPGRSDQWALNRLKAEDLRTAFTSAGRAWSDVPVVAVLDTGVQGDHPDLAGRTVAGLDVLTDTALAPGAAADPNGHGTHVAGIIGANVGNATGTAGLLDQARIMPVRVLDANGNGYVSDIAEGVVWAVDNGAKVLNLSLGGPATSALETAISYARGQGVVVVAAAGNDGHGGNRPEYPCTYTTVLCVGAATESNTRAYFSTHGSQVDIAAPGFEVLSTWHGSQYAYLNGTSMATPYAAAAAALVAGAHPTDSVGTILTRLANTADDLGSPGRDASFGAGLVNVLRAAELQPAGTPGAPQSLRVAFGRPGQAVVRFSAPVDTGVAVTGYRVRVGTAAPVTVSSGAGVVVQGLLPGRPYAVSVSALSAAGEGRLSSLPIVVVDALTATVKAGAPTVTSGGTMRAQVNLSGRSAVTGSVSALRYVPVEVYVGRTSATMTLRATLTTNSQGIAAYSTRIGADALVRFRYRGRTYSATPTALLPAGTMWSSTVIARAR